MVGGFRNMLVEVGQRVQYHENYAITDKELQLQGTIAQISRDDTDFLMDVLVQWDNNQLEWVSLYLLKIIAIAIVDLWLDALNEI